MSKTETLRQSAAASNAIRAASLANQIESLRASKAQSAEDLAQQIEPLAQALAALTDETRQTLASIERRAKEQGATFDRQLSASTASYKDAAAQASQAADRLNQAGRRMEWRHYGIAVATGAASGIVTAALVTLSWLYLAPPKVHHQIDTEALATLLAPALIEAQRQQRRR